MNENQMDSAIHCGRMLLASDKGPRRGTKAHLLLSRLFDKALAECKEGEGSYEFNWTNIAEDSEVYDEGKQLRRVLSVAIDIWSRHIEVAKEIAVDNELSHIPILEKVTEGSGAGVMNLYAIRAELVDKGALPSKVQIPLGYIRYTPEMIDRPNWLGKLVNGLMAKGWVMRFLIGSVALAVGLATLAAWFGLWSLHVQDSIYGLVQAAITTLFSLFVIYLFFSPLYYCVTRRIIMAPVLMNTNVTYEAQLEYIKSDQFRSDGRPIMQFRLVSYTANCQLCGDRINVHDGSFGRWGRMIGRCGSNPEEHIYSFDHVTRLGRLIYPEYAHLVDSGYRPFKDESGGTIGG